MALQTDIPSRFWTVGPGRVTHTEEVVGVTNVAKVLEPTTRAVLVFNLSNTGQVYFRADGVVATTANGQPMPGNFPYWIYIDGGDGQTAVTLNFIADAAAQDLRFMEVDA